MAAGLRRRRLLVLSCALAATLSQPATAQSRERPLALVGVFSLLGDGVEVTVHDPAPIGTGPERTRREQHEFRQIGFDAIAAREVRAAFASLLPATRLAVFAATAPITAAEQQRIARSAHEGALPAWVLQSVRQRQLSHVLLITRQRGEVSLQTEQGQAIGRGRADGIGFFIDPKFTLRNAEGSALAQGALGPHVFVELTLMDTDSAKVVRQHTVREQVLIAPTEQRVENDPWGYLTQAEKISMLRNMLERGLKRALAEVLKAP